jgi:SMC interacting uncharacterized protein involved in chromosome segregation
MDDTSLLLTEEFQAFSSKIKAIFEEKKAKKEQLKALYDKVQAEIKALDAKAKAAEDEFNKWKSSQKGKPQD